MALLSNASVEAQTALVLGGGGSRGLAHAGALRGLEARGWDPDFIAGTSMGALVGALYASGLPADSVWKVVTNRDWREVFAFPPVSPMPDAGGRYPMLQLGLGVDRARFAEGIVADFRINRLLVRHLFDAAARARGDFDALPRAYRAVAADLATGEEVVIRRGDLARAARASMAVPGVFAPVLAGGRALVDGGVADYLPVKPAREAGYDTVLAIDVIQPPPDGVALNPFQSAIRSFRLIMMRARIDTVDASVRIVPAIDPDLSAAVFPSDPTSLLELGRRAAERQAPLGPGRVAVRTARDAPSVISRVDIEAADPALRTLTARAFRSAAGPYDPDAILAAVDRLLATGLAYGVWPRIEADPERGPDAGVLIVRADAAPPVLANGAVAFESDRGGRAWGALAFRPFTQAATITLSGEHESLRASAALALRQPLHAAPSISIDAGASLTETEIRSFDDESPESEVRRAGAWAGARWMRIEPDWRAGIWMRAEQVLIPGARGSAVGPYTRIERVEQLGLIVGVPFLVEAEARYGDFDYRRIRARASQRLSIGRLRLAALLDATSTNGAAPDDVRPALGDDHLVPGLAWGYDRNDARLVAGLDLAWPIPLDGHARIRIRSGATADRFEALDQARWWTGVEGAVTWWTPFGRIEGGVGVERRGRPRLELRFGPPW